MGKVDGDIFAIGNFCPHFGGKMTSGKIVEGCKLECPWHGALFDMKTGKVESGPTTDSLPHFDVV